MVYLSSVGVFHGLPLVIKITGTFITTVILQIFSVVLFSVISVVNGFRLHQVNSLFLVQRAHGFGKKSENKTKKMSVFFRA